ncbi:MAG TPA: SGNH/GDSL hydrolase family protein [Pseudolabrys sp.]|nr:SGNH/GDSL hydrolase family protein [Pseudolabrys sp.]
MTVEDAPLSSDTPGRQVRKLAAAAALLAGVAIAFPVCAETAAPDCDAPRDLVRLANPLPHIAQKVTAGAPITIVAIGSSSTAGAGASSPAANYPSRLAVELKERFPAVSITMLNRGVGGEEVADMLKRFDAAVLAAKPDLVLWQLGTNSVIRGHKLGDHGALIRTGLSRIRSIGADVVLIDPQFAPKVISKPEAEEMVTLISVTAKRENVDLFRRFDVMRHWRDVDHLGFETFVSPDGLHMNDWSYACMARGLANAIAEAAQRPILSATAAPHLAR